MNALKGKDREQLLQKAKEGKTSLRELVEQAFCRHPRGDAFRSLTRRPAALQQAIDQWQPPWMFTRLFGILLLMTLLCVACIWYDIANVRAPYIYAFFWGCAVMPLPLALFLWELDIRAGFTIFEMVGFAFAAGVVCIAVGLPIWILVVLQDPISLWMVWKDTLLSVLLTVCVLLRCKRKLYGLDGLALGAAIGAGYALFDQLLWSMPKSYSKEAVLLSLRTAGFSLFGNHALWLAPIAGALCLRMNGGRLKAKHLLDVRFLLLLLLGMVENGLMNAEHDQLNQLSFLNNALIDLPAFQVFIKHPLLLVSGLAALLYMIRLCMKQTVQSLEGETQAEKAFPERPQTKKLFGVEGTYAGQIIPLTSGLSLPIGREASQGALTLASRKVSRSHCMFLWKDGQLMLRDLNSANGTYLNGTKLKADQVVPVRRGDLVAIGSEKERFEVQ